MNSKKKVVVVGINHAGTSAVRTLLNKSDEYEVVAYDRNDNISFLGCGIALTVSGVVKDLNSLFYANKQSLENLGAEIYMNHDVVSIDEKAKTVTTKNLATNKDKIESYDKLIYAAGSWPIDLGIKNKHLEGVHICKIFQHAENLINQANDKKIKNVVVIGAGYIGIELTEAFTEKGKNVTLVDMADRILPRYFDKEYTNRLEKAMRENKVNLALNTKTLEYVDNGKGQVCKVSTTTGEIEADLVIEAIGFKPNTELLPNLDKVKNGALIVNSKMQTSNSDIYALGDCCAIYHASTKTYENIALATNAVKTGIVAASQIAGEKSIKLDSVVGTNAISVFGHNLASTGLSEESARAMGLDIEVSYYEDNDRPEFMEITGKVAIKLVYDKSSMRLLGAQIGSYENSCHTEVIYYLALAIQKEMTLTEIAMTDVYFLPHFNKPFNFVLSAILKAAGFTYI